MNRPARRNLTVFGCCSAALLLAMWWITNSMLRLERDKVVANAKAQHQIAISQALWRMDSWLASRLAGEAARPYYEYQAYFPQGMAYTKLLSEIEKGEIIVPSPLLTYRSDIFLLHFQVDEAGKVTSPQAPDGNWRDLAESRFAALKDIDQKVALLDSVKACLPPRVEGIATCYGCAALTQVVEVPNLSTARNKAQQEFYSRARQNVIAKQSSGENEAWRNQSIADAATIHIEPLLPIWRPRVTSIGEVSRAGATEFELMYIRRVRVAGKSLFQGILVDWPRLRAALLERAMEILPAAPVTLRPVAATEVAPAWSNEAGHSRTLVTVSAELVADTVPSVDDGWNATHGGLIAAWIGLLVTLLAVGSALHSTNQLAERRARFASAVTHELRTPLTTFRMYSEMLAEDMVEDEDQRRAYLNTLKAESDRLSRLVENVLSYSRLEDGRHTSHPETLGLSALMSRITPVLERRLEETRLKLVVAAENHTDVHVDVDAVTQILFNLVDNAGKYAQDSNPPLVEVHATRQESTVKIRVRDHGPGVGAEHRGEIFRPFERGDYAAGDNQTPGIGLGLALARGLARDLGGDLELLVNDSRQGAEFELTIPCATTV